MSDDKLPIFGDQILKMYGYGKAWGIYTEKSGLDITQAWRIIFKQQLTYTNDYSINVGFMHSSNDEEWISGPNGGQFSSSRIVLARGGQDNPVVPESYFNTTNPTYTVITRINDGTINIELYDHNYTLLYNTHFTDGNTTHNMIFTVYYNRSTANLLGVLVEQDNTITPDNLNKMLLMNSYVRLQIKNHRLSYHKAYFGSLIDYYVSIDSSGVIHLSGQKPQTKNPTIKLGLEAEGDDRTRTIEPIIPNKNLTNHDGVTWFKPAYDAYSSTPVINNHEKPVLILGGIDLTNYLAHGYTICFYISNFKYESTNSEKNIEYNLKALMTQLVDTGSSIIQFRHKLFNDGYDVDIRDTSIGIVAANPQINKYEYTNSNEFKYNDDESPITSSPEDRDSIWLIGISHKHGNTPNDFENEPSADHKSVQFFYKRTNYKRVNSSRIWEPTFNNQGDWDNERLGRLFKNKTWFMFGTAHDDVANGDNYVPLISDTPYTDTVPTLYEQWTSKKIDVGDNNFKPMVCEYSEIMFLNKALTYNEFSALAELQPGDARLKFG